MNHIVLKDNSLHIIQNEEDFLNLVYEVMGKDSMEYLKENLSEEKVKETEKYYENILEKIRDVTYGY